MKNRKQTVFMSVLTIMLCLFICIGSTYAFFVDASTNSGNKIQSGRLKVDLELCDRATGDWNSIKDSTTPVFLYEKWEPGYTDVKLLRVRNDGTLAIKWEARFASEKEISEFANAIKVYVKIDNELAYPQSGESRNDYLQSWTEVGTLADFINSDVNVLAKGTLSKQNDVASFGIALHMPITTDDNDNQYQGQVLGEFDIQIVATQFTYESDAYGPDYDKDATYPDLGPSEEPIVYSEGLEYELVETGEGAPYFKVVGFGTCTDVDIVIPDTHTDAEGRTHTVKEIGDSAFCVSDPYLGIMPMTKSLKSVVIPDSVTSIGGDAFLYCESLERVVIPEGVTTIGSRAFGECYSLASIEIPHGVTDISFNMLGACTSLTSITIPVTVTSFERWSFAGCPLEDIYYAGTAEQWMLIQGRNQIEGDYIVHCAGDVNIDKNGSIVEN